MWAWIDQTSFFKFLRLPFREKKWTACKKWKRNGKKFNFYLNLFLVSRINYSRNWKFFYQSCVKSTWNCAWNLAFSCIYLTYCMEYVWKSSLWIGIFQRATQRARILLTDNTQSGGSCSVNYYYSVKTRWGGQCTPTTTSQPEYPREKNETHFINWARHK